MTGFGSSITGTGDFNGDGFQDFVIGSYQHESSIYLVFGRSRQHFANNRTLLGSIEATTFSFEQGIIFTVSSPATVFGWAISSAGDFNSDGYADLLVGSFTDASVFLVFGGSGALLKGRGWDIGTTPLIIDPESFTNEQGCIFKHSDPASYFGWDVSSAQDINNDGIDDIMVGAWASASVYIFFGKASGLPTPIIMIPMGEFDSDIGILVKNSVNTASTFGFTLSRAGDVNKDGFKDLIIGAHGERTAYLLFGPLKHSFMVESSPPSSSKLYTCLINSNASSSFGVSTVGIGDFNNDLYDDVLITDTLTGNAFLVFNYQFCETPCLRCNTDNSTCVTCVPEFPYLYDGHCYESCPDNYDTKTCLNCVAGRCSPIQTVSWKVMLVVSIVGLVLIGIVIYLWRRNKRGKGAKIIDVIRMQENSRRIHPALSDNNKNSTLGTISMMPIRSGVVSSDFKSLSPTKEGVHRLKRLNQEE